MTQEQYLKRKQTLIIQQEGNESGFYTSPAFLEELQDETNWQNMNADILEV